MSIISSSQQHVVFVKPPALSPRSLFLHEVSPILSLVHIHPSKVEIGIFESTGVVVDVVFKPPSASASIVGAQCQLERLTFA